MSTKANRIKCDLCSNGSNIEYAEYIHLSVGNKLTLVCGKCLKSSKAGEEIFYLPLQQQQQKNLTSQQQQGQQQQFQSSKYLKSITFNHPHHPNPNHPNPPNPNPHHPNPNPNPYKQLIQNKFFSKIWQPFSQLQQSINSYRSIINQYKKRVRSQYKAILSIIDPNILQTFKQLIIEMHESQSIIKMKKNNNNINRQSIQKQEMDLMISAMKLSVNNQWRDMERLMHSMKRSYDKIEKVFVIEKQQLKKRGQLLKRMLGKLTVEYMYGKGDSSSDRNSKEKGNISMKKRRENNITINDSSNDNNNEIVLIDQQQQQEINQCMNNSNSNKSSNSSISNNNSIKSSSNNYPTNKCNPSIQQKQLIELEQQQYSSNNHHSHQKGRQQQSRQQPQQKYDHNQKLNPLQLSPSQRQLKSQQQQQCNNNNASINNNKNNNNITLLYPNLSSAASTVNCDSRLQQQQLATINNINSSTMNLNKTATTTNPICVQIIQDQDDIDQQQPNYQYDKHNRGQLLTNNHNNNNNIDIDIQIRQYQTFQISVQNYTRPLQSLRNRLTKDSKITKLLKQHKISLPSILYNSNSNPIDHSIYLSLIKRLKITYTRKHYLDSLLKILTQCNNLSQLTITQPLLSTQQVISFIINTLPNLKKLQFLCYNQLNQQHLSTITNNLPLLQQLYYGPKCYNNIALKSQYRQFNEHQKRKRKSSLPNLVLMRFLQKMNDLTNIWLSESHLLEEILQSIVNNQHRKQNNIKHLIIGGYVIDEVKQQPPLELSQQAWQLLQKMHGLRSLALINININAKYLQKILTKNSTTLKSLEIYSCANFTDTLASRLKNCRQLTQFYLFRSQKSIFLGHTIWQATSLQTIVLRSCQFMSDNSARNKIGRMSQLKHVDFDGCQWFDDSILEKLVQNQHITYLNLANTGIGSKFEQHLRLLFKIRCLALGSTQTTALNIQQLCAQFPQIEKLSLYNLCGSAVIYGRCMIKKNRLNKIGDTLKSIKYLDIGSLGRADDTVFDHFPTVKTFNLWMATGISQKKKQQIKDKGVNIIDDM